MIGGRKVLAFVVSLLFVCKLALADATHISTDSALLNTLVSKGIFSESDAMQIKKSMAEEHVIMPTGDEIIRFGGYTQFRFYALNQEYHSEDKSGEIHRHRFSMPRMVIKVFADIDENYTTIMALNLSAKKEIFDTFYLARQVDSDYLVGELQLGYSAPRFHMEPTNGARLKTLDRCILNTYWGGKDMGFSEEDYSSNAKQCFSGSYMGVFWRGRMPSDKRFFYDLSVANAKNGYYIEQGRKLGLSYWGSFGFDSKIDSVGLMCGVSAGYSSNLVSVYDHAGGSKRSSCLGVTPYLIVNYENIFLQTQFVFSQMEYGKILSDTKPIYTTQSADTCPYGIMVMPSYTFDIGEWGKLEPIFRFAYLNTDGGGVAEGNILANATSPNGYYNKALAYYVGLNWYINEHATKVLFGFEHLRFSDSPNGARAKESKAYMCGIQLQLEF